MPWDRFKTSDSGRESTASQGSVYTSFFWWSVSSLTNYKEDLIDACHDVPSLVVEGPIAELFPNSVVGSPLNGLLQKSCPVILVSTFSRRVQESQCTNENHERGPPYEKKCDEEKGDEDGDGGDGITIVDLGCE